MRSGTSERTAERPPDLPRERERPAARGGVHWASPQVLIPLLACLAAAGYAIRSTPPATPPPPALTLDEAAAPTAPPMQETALYVVDAEGVARPVVVEVPAHDDPSERLQNVVSALRAEMLAEGAWPAALPAPYVHAFDLERREVAVLDLPAADVRLDVASERILVASLERTLLEEGVERVAYLRDGRAVPAWLGHLATPSSFD